MGDRKTEKKIRNYNEFLREYLASVIRRSEELGSLSDEKDIKKMKKRIRSDEGMVEFYIEHLNELGYDFSNIENEFEPEEIAILSKLFPYGFGKEVIDKHKERASNIQFYKDMVIKLKKAETKYEPYDPALPVKEKLKKIWAGICFMTAKKAQKIIIRHGTMRSTSPPQWSSRKKNARS